MPDKPESKQWKKWRLYLDFVDQAIGDSPHQGDDEMMQHHFKMMEKLRRLLKRACDKKDSGLVPKKT
jgi:hypothetical protein